MPPTAGHPSVPLNYFPGEVLATVQCDPVLDFIIQHNHEKFSTVFSNITPPQYISILCAVEKLAGKPRLAYDNETFQLEVEMPSCVHDSVINIIRCGLESLDESFQELVTGRLINSDLYSSLTLNTGKKEFVPDCVHIITARCNPPIRKVSSMIEVAYSQSETALLDRFRHAIKAYPELAMILMVVINENPAYQSPKRLSHTWRELRPRLGRHFCSETTFISMRAEPRSLDEPNPVIVENHSWCTISSIQVQVWIRGRKSPINIDTKDNHLTARGDLFPVNAANKSSMANVTRTIVQGLALTKDCYIEQCHRVDVGANVSALRAFQFPLPFDWDNVLDRLTYAMHTTAHDRYRSWYYHLQDTIEVTAGVKRTADEVEIDTNDEHLVHMCTRSRKKGRGAARSASCG